MGFGISLPRISNPFKGGGGIGGIFKRAENNVLSIQKIVDPAAYLVGKDVQQKVPQALGTILGAPQVPNTLLGDTGASRRQAVDENTTEEKEQAALDKVRKRRQGAGAGSTLLTTADDDNLRLERSTLLGM